MLRRDIIKRFLRKVKGYLLVYFIRFYLGKAVFIDSKY